MQTQRRTRRGSQLHLPLFFHYAWLNFPRLTEGPVPRLLLDLPHALSNECILFSLIMVGNEKAGLHTPNHSHENSFMNENEHATMRADDVFWLHSNTIIMDSGTCLGVSHFMINLDFRKC